MSSETLPITPGRFAAALKDLSLASLHLKTLELRNSLAHLAYSNAQLRPFADGTETSLHGGARGRPDPDCVDAIRENEAVMRRMRERILLVRAEVEGRGVSWREFEGEVVGVAAAEEEEEVDDGGGEPGVVGAGVPPANGVNGNGTHGPATNTNETPSASTTTTTTTAGGNPWADGTFQTGVIRNGEIHMDAVPGGAAAGAAPATSNAATGSGGGGRLTDAELRRMLEERLAEDDGDEEDGGLHL